MTVRLLGAYLAGLLTAAGAVVVYCWRAWREGE